MVCPRTRSSSGVPNTNWADVTTRLSGLAAAKWASCGGLKTDVMHRVSPTVAHTSRIMGLDLDERADIMCDMDALQVSQHIANYSALVQAIVGLLTVALLLKQTLAPVAPIKK